MNSANNYKYNGSQQINIINEFLFFTKNRVHI